MSTDRDRRDYLPLDERRERVLDAAIELVADEGAGALTLRGIAARMGVAHRVVHYAFGSREALLTELLRRESRRTMARVWDEEFAIEPFGRAVQLALEAYVADLRARAGVHRAVSELTAVALSTPSLIASVRAESVAYRDAIGDRIARWGATSGSRLTQPSDVVAAAILATADGLRQWWLASGDEHLVEPVLGVLAGAFSGLEIAD